MLILRIESDKCINLQERVLKIRQKISAFGSPKWISNSKYNIQQQASKFKRWYLSIDSTIILNSINVYKATSIIHNRSCTV